MSSLLLREGSNEGGDTSNGGGGVLHSPKSVLSFSRGYTITLSAPPPADEEEAELSENADHFMRLASSKSDKSEELLPPEAYLADVPLSRTESVFPSLDDVAHDVNLRETLGSVGAHVSVRDALQHEDPKERCAALHRLLAKSTDDPDWAASLACDGPTLGSLVHWIRRQLQRGYELLRRGSGSVQPSLAAALQVHSTSTVPIDAGVPPPSPPEALACLCVALKLLRNLCAASPRCPVHLADAGLPDALLDRIEELDRSVVLAKKSFEEAVEGSSWCRVELDALMQTVPQVLSNMSTGQVAPQRIWASLILPDSLMGLVRVYSDNPSAIFSFLHNLTANLSDDVLCPRLLGPEGLAVIFAYFSIALHNSPSLEEWVLLFSCRFWGRKGGEILPALIRSILLFDVGTLGPPPPNAPWELAEAVVGYHFTILEDILEFEQKKQSERKSHPTDLALLPCCLDSPAFHEMFISLMSQGAKWLTSSFALGESRIPAHIADRPNGGQWEMVVLPGREQLNMGKILKPFVRTLIIIASNSHTGVIPTGTVTTGDVAGSSTFVDCSIELLLLTVGLLDRLSALRLERMGKKEIIGGELDDVMEVVSCRDLLLLAANFLFERPAVQDALHQVGGLGIFLNFTHIDGKDPFMREAAVFAIRNASQGHAESQRELSDLLGGEFRGVVSVPSELQEAGGLVEFDGESKKLKLRKKL